MGNGDGTIPAWGRAVVANRKRELPWRQPTQKSVDEGEA